MKTISEKEEKVKQAPSHKRMKGYQAVPIIINGLWGLIRNGYRDHTAAEWASLLGMSRRWFFYAMREVRKLDTGLSITVLHRNGIRIERNIDRLFGVHPSRAYHLCPSKEIRKASRIEKNGDFERQNWQQKLTNTEKHRCHHWMGRLKRLLWRWGATPIFRDWGVELEKCVGVIVWKWRWAESRLLAVERGLWRLVSGPYVDSTPKGLCRNNASIKARWGYAFLCLKKIEAMGQVA